VLCTVNVAVDSVAAGIEDKVVVVVVGGCSAIIEGVAETAAGLLLGSYTNLLPLLWSLK
jgi:hypothetical protein